MKMLGRVGMAAAALIALGLSGLPASAQDKVKVGVFPISSSLPYYVAIEKGLLQRSEYRAGDDQAYGRSAERGGADDQPDRSLRGAGHARRSQCRRQETRRRDVYRDAQPDTGLQDGAVRRPRGPARQGEVAQGSQGPQADVGAGPGQPQHRQGRARQGRPQGRRLHDRPARHGSARQRHEGRNVRRAATRSNPAQPSWKRWASQRRSKPA